MSVNLRVGLLTSGVGLLALGRSLCCNGGSVCCLSNGLIFILIDQCYVLKWISEFAFHFISS